MSNTITTTINYSTRPADGSGPFTDLTKTDPATGKFVRNWTEQPTQIEVEDLRGKENSATLDTTGFQFGTHKSAVEGFYDEQEIKDVYYPESVELIKQATGASDVLIFDHTVRRRNPNVDGTDPTKRQPALNAHVDQTPEAAIVRVHRHVPAAEAKARLDKRFQIINLWRPIQHPAFDTPLALCDYRSVDYDKDLVASKLIFPGRVGETFNVAENPNHRWKYVSGLRPDEYALIKCFDTKKDIARLTPHTAFTDPTTPADAPARQSIELRALVFYD